MNAFPTWPLKRFRPIALFALFTIVSGIPRFAAAQLTFRWARIQDGYHKDDYINDLDIDNLGNVYVAGWVTNSADNTDYFVAKYDRAGTDNGTSSTIMGGTIRRDRSQSRGRTSTSPEEAS
ncbi:MAG: hypothetical protein E6K56_08385 [Ignavibacteria bacterium]|nr:MAG: hypothetical protein E6K56_08385 [Ignavibacteria bacterium]